MQILVKKVEDLELPKQANDGEDASYDVKATTHAIVVGDFKLVDGKVLYKRIDYIEYGTNLFIEPLKERVVNNVVLSLNDSGGLSNSYKRLDLESYHTKTFARSSISKMNLVLANSVGTIDEGYRSQIMCRFKYIIQPEDMHIITQDGIVSVMASINWDKVYKLGDKIVQIQACRSVPIKFKVVDELSDSKRKHGGFGSSGA